VWFIERYLATVCRGMADGHELGEALEIAIEQFFTILSEFYTAHSDERREMAEKEIQRWVTAPESTQVALAILMTRTDVVLRFYAVLCLKNFVRSHFRQISSDSRNELFSLLAEQILANTDVLDRPDMKAVLVLLADLSLLDAFPLDQIIPRFNPDVLMKFCCIIYEEAYEPFVVKYKLSGARDIGKLIFPRVCELLSKRTISVDWMHLYSLSFRAIGYPPWFLEFLPKLRTALDNPEFFPSLIEICEFGNHFDSCQEDDRTDLYVEQIFEIMIILANRSPHMFLHLWSLMFSYSHAFSLAPERRPFLHSLISKFLSDLPNAFLLNDDVSDCLERFSELLNEPDARQDLSIYKRQFWSIVIEAIESGALVLRREMNDLHAAMRKTIDASPELSTQFLMEVPVCSGLFYAAAFSRDQNVCLHLLNQLGTLNTVNVFAIHWFLSEIVMKEYVEPFVLPIIQFCFNNFGLITMESSGLLKSLALGHTQAVLQMYDELRKCLFPILLTIGYAPRARLIVMFWILIASSGESKDEDLGFLGNIILERSTALNCLENILKYLEFLRTLIWSSGQTGSPDFMREYYKYILSQLLPGIVDLFCLPSGSVQAALCSVIYHCVQSRWAVEPSFLEAWVHKCLELNIFQERHLEVLKMVELWPDSQLMECLVRVTPEEDPDFICQLLGYFLVLAHKDFVRFWNMVSVDYILNFLDADVPTVLESVLHFVMGLLDMDRPDGIVDNTIERVLIRFSELPKSSGKVVCEFLKESVRKLQKFEFIASTLEKLYPKPCDSTNLFLQNLGNGHLIIGTLPILLGNHINFNKHS
jgi:hypothetical protein